MESEYLGDQGELGIRKVCECGQAFIAAKNGRNSCYRCLKRRKT